MYGLLTVNKLGKPLILTKTPAIYAFRAKVEKHEMGNIKVLEHATTKDLSSVFMWASAYCGVVEQWVSWHGGGGYWTGYNMSDVFYIGLDDNDLDVVAGNKTGFDVVAGFKGK